MAFADTRVVLVRPHYAGNLGSVARVMHNFGLSRLILVAPVADPTDREARRLSTHGEFILDRVRLVPDLATAVADCTTVAATSSNVDGLIRDTSVVVLRDATARLIESMGHGSLAIVFGPEPSGLTNGEISLCHHLLRIPTSPEYPALNLAQAVAITLYELFSSQLRNMARSGEPIATHEEQERMFAHLRQGLEAIHFLYGPKADSLMYALRHMLGRAGLTAQEVAILHGLARQLLWVSCRAADRDNHLDEGRSFGL